MDEIVTLISNVGFPMAVAIWWMVRGEKVISNNTEMLSQVKLLIEECKKP